MDFLKKIQGEEATISYEFFPPRTPKAAALLEKTLADSAEMGLDFISVTYGAGGSTRELTAALVKSAQSDLEVAAMAHLTCVGHGSDELRALLSDFDRAGVAAVMALRGDPPKGNNSFVPHPDGFVHADQLIALIKQEYPRFKIGCATYPEGHPESESVEFEAQILRLKQERGADFAITQLFFDNRDFFRFREIARAAGVTIPILPGIMPVSSIAQIERSCELSRCTLPPELVELVKIVDAGEEIGDRGFEFTLRQCRELLEAGAPGIHLYTLNHSQLSCRLVESLRASGHLSSPSSL